MGLSGETPESLIQLIQAGFAIQIVIILGEHLKLRAALQGSQWFGFLLFWLLVRRVLCEVQFILTKAKKKSICATYHLRVFSDFVFLFISKSCFVLFITLFFQVGEIELIEYLFMVLVWLPAFSLADKGFTNTANPWLIINFYDWHQFMHFLRAKHIILVLPVLFFALWATRIL